MIAGRQVVALIPARGGSKGLPGKNIRPLCGRPLIGWSIAAARESGVVDRIVVSTDDEAIAAVALAEGAEVAPRPSSLAGDTALAADLMRHHLAEWRLPDEALVAYLQPTSPLRLGEDISGGAARLIENGWDSLAGFCEAGTHPDAAWRIEGDQPQPWSGKGDWRPRQDRPSAWALNGALYLFRASAFPADGSSFLFGRTGAWIMPADRSIDIDDIVDFTVAEALMTRRLG
ncbi:cytidylyltransferase domain-containing protein [Brevundimonas lutea]|uniref:acylneuraminate cytidylyltransferase family protein n=1 Tax=Brevundimonas lutea TaxID=2293980 RepID=UPI000F012E89|nr:acylneuraminate cytidylyltransferase family protein [Brevundimonas lutea]